MCMKFELHGEFRPSSVDRVNFQFSARLRDDFRGDVAIFGTFAALWWRFSELRTPTLTVGTSVRARARGVDDRETVSDALFRR